MAIKRPKPEAIILMDQRLIMTNFILLMSLGPKSGGQLG